MRFQPRVTSCFRPIVSQSVCRLVEFITNPCTQIAQMVRVHGIVTLLSLNQDINNDWPDLWSAKQTEDFKSKNPWLGSKNKKLGCLVCSSVNSIGIDKEQGVSLSREWMNFEIQVSGQGSRTTSLSVLRNKVRKHALSKAHTQAVKVAEKQKEAAIENAVETMTESYMKEAVFRTAYHLAKKNRPFSDHESLIELQELNGVCCM
ncbi:E3 SUMO-protein ligase KIAA1586-like [Perca fluviatilis]|uniref:E3 SUMO-protein ligase KIAA1586-like n=1 Tax=Perca fluviatilis TaxID=8168 RepID=UPI00196453E4|nr:E3 SUMO-protein ligase KIAA1586-like [Perca fluviatilis]